MYIKTHSKDGQEQVRGKIDKAKWTGQNHFHFFLLNPTKHSLESAIMQAKKSIRHFYLSF